MERKKLEIDINKEDTSWIQDFIQELSERLKKMEELLVVDRIEGKIAVCQNRKNGEMKDIPISELPENIEEGSILKWKNNKYIIDDSKEIEQRIENKMKDVWK